jgi:hypothetical protein
MAVPIADDWKAINDRMQQIQAERSVASRRCAICDGLGWIPGPFGGPHRAVTCDLCHNPKGLSPPRFIPRK